MGLFEVYQNDHTDYHFTVYAVEKHGTGALFLIFYGLSWKWVSSLDYSPLPG